jgi:hypothetical protein
MVLLMLENHPRIKEFVFMPSAEGGGGFKTRERLAM